MYTDIEACDENDPLYMKNTFAGRLSRVKQIPIATRTKGGQLGCIRRTVR